MICHAVYSNDLILKNPPYLSIFLLSNLYHTISFQELLEDLINLCVVCNCLFYTQWGWLHYTKNLYILCKKKKMGFWIKKDLKHNENSFKRIWLSGKWFSVFFFQIYRPFILAYFLPYTTITNKNLPTRNRLNLKSILKIKKIIKSLTFCHNCSDLM